MSHVLARLNGYGVQLVPYWPYRFERTGTDVPTVRAVHVTQDGERSADIDPGNPSSVDGVVDVGTEPSPDGWRVETSTFSVPWPGGFHVGSPTGAADPTPYYLLGPDDVAIFPQGVVPNERVPRSSALAVAGQRVTDQRSIGGIEVIELRYEHDGGAWWQNHCLIPWGATATLVFTAQAPEALAERAREAIETVARGSWPTGVALP